MTQEPQSPESEPPSPFRRLLLGLAAAAGVAGVAGVFARALAVRAEGAEEVTSGMIRDAEWISGITLSEEQRELMLRGVQGLTESYGRIRAVELDNGVSPALVFRPLTAPGAGPGREAEPGSALVPGPPAQDPPGDPTDLAFARAVDLAGWVAAGKVTARDLTELSLDRLARFDDTLACVIELTPDRAREQAVRVDAERTAGTKGGALSGVPWGAKDLLAVKGSRTTWGAQPFRDQRRPETAAAVERLDGAGAILTAKLTVGALAWGDVWYGGTTKNPWNPEQGSSGSSAGPAAATAAGLVAFALGTETWGSIVSPCTRCGVTGLRPTFGRVSRHGCMALSWSMDKIGPIARSARDCAWIFSVLHGADPRDPSTHSAPFAVPGPEEARTLRVGVTRDLFDADRGAASDDVEDEGPADEGAAAARAREWGEIDRRTVRELSSAGLELQDVRLPDDLPVDDLAFVLTAEAATAFDGLTRSGRDAELVRQVEFAWPNVFRQGQTIPAVEYLRAQRIRRLLMERMEEVFRTVDVVAAPSFEGSTLLLTNLTGHPSITMPNGFRQDGTPTSITLLGRLDGERELLAVARAWQESTDYHLRRPPVGG
jgi:Asp-tRNA(Asn)/Glu-tRNA(Gln) amidotransferase A subunit family amidase